MDKYVESYDIVTSMEEYEQLSDDKKKSYDVVLPQMWGESPKILEA